MVEYLILGAGCAGLGLAVALLDAGVTREEIVLVDRRTTFGRDRTWGLWDQGDPRWSRLAGRRWSSWAVRTRGAAAVQHAPRHPYLHLAADDFYAWALERLDRAPNVTVRLGERVRGAGPSDAAWVHDARGLGSPAVDPAAVGLWQGFVGQEVETERPVFTPGRATLMDFRTPQAGELRFVYVLPFSRTRALVEHTSLGARRVAPRERRAALAAFLGEELGAGAWTVLREEAGRLPMELGVGVRSRGRGAATEARAPGASRRSGDPGPRRTAVGIAAGAIRPSSGYAFARIQGHVREVAAAIVTGREPPARAGNVRGAALDALFLRGLAARPEAFPAIFLALAQRTSGDAFARFMSDASTPLDEARVMAALAPTRFLPGVAAGLLGRRAEG